MTAELLSLCFHAGPVHRDGWSVSRRMIDTGGAGGSRTARSRENAAPLDEVAYDKRIGDETRPLKGNYFGCCLKGSLLTFFFSISCFHRGKNILKMVQNPEE